jgi:hypothetical protein
MTPIVVGLFFSFGPFSCLSGIVLSNITLTTSALLATSLVAVGSRPMSSILSLVFKRIAGSGERTITKQVDVG